jgi:hypothetical protein
LVIPADNRWRAIGLRAAHSGPRFETGTMRSGKPAMTGMQDGNRPYNHVGSGAAVLGRHSPSPGDTQTGRMLGSGMACRRNDAAPGAEPAMVSKCANPACNTRFRYLHEGRIFSVQADKNHRRDGVGASVERYWLCSTCSSSMTLVIEHGHVNVRTLASIPEAGLKPAAPATSAVRHRSIA